MIGRIFGGSVRVFQGAFPSLLVATLVFSLPAQLLMEYVVYHHIGSEDFTRQMRLYVTVYAILAPFLAAAGIMAARAVVDGQDLRPWALVREAASNWGAIIKVQIPAGILIVLGTLALLIPGFVLMARWALIESIALEEGLGPKACRRRSRELVSRSVGSVLLALLALFLPSFLISGVGGALMGFDAALDGFVFSAVTSSVSDLLGMLTYIGMFLVYRERTGALSRAEAFDTRPQPIG